MINTGKLWALGSVCLLAAGCVYGPFHDDTIASTTSRITFNLYATQTEAVMTAECATHSSGFSAFGSKTASASPTTLNGESIYAAQLERVIPASCWDFGFGKPVTYLRFFQTKDGQTYNVMTFDNAGRTCIRDHFADGEGPVTAASLVQRPTIAISYASSPSADERTRPFACEVRPSPTHRERVGSQRRHGRPRP